MKHILILSVAFGFSTLSCHLDKLTDSGMCDNPPSAAFSIQSDPDCKAPCTVTILNTSTNAARVVVKFGDGDSTLLTGSSITHTYVNPGSYDISLVASGVVGCSNNTATKQLLVGSSQPVPIAGFIFDLSDHDGFAPCTVSFTNTSINATTGYSWDFGDSLGTSTQPSPTYTYPKPGDYMVKLTATGGGTSHSTTKTVQIKVMTFKKTYGAAPDNDYGRAVRQTPDGGYIIVGSTDSVNNAGNAYVVTTDFKGTAISQEVFQYGRWINALDLTAQGYAVAGNTTANNNNEDVYIAVKDGNTTNNVYIDGGSVDYGYSVQQTSDGGFIIAGKSHTINGTPTSYSNVFLVKTNGNGSPTWTKTYGGMNEDVGYTVRQTLDGGYIIAGYTFSEGNGSSDVYLIKTDASGDSLWTKTFGGPNGEKAYSLQITSDGGYIIAGSVDNGSSYLDVYLLKTDANGTLEGGWPKSYGGPYEEVGFDVQ